MNQECKRGHYEERLVEGWLDDHVEQVWVKDCRWTSPTTFTDRCTVCGKIYRYVNHHNYPDRKLEGM